MDNFLDLGTMGVPLGDRVYGVWNTSSFIIIFVIVIIVAMLASLVPSYWAARKNPIDAIQHK